MDTIHLVGPVGQVVDIHNKSLTITGTEATEATIQVKLQQLVLFV